MLSKAWASERWVRGWPPGAVIKALCEAGALPTHPPVASQVDNQRRLVAELSSKMATLQSGVDAAAVRARPRLQRCMPACPLDEEMSRQCNPVMLCTLPVLTPCTCPPAPLQPWYDALESLHHLLPEDEARDRLTGESWARE